jgi:type IV pilus assembly protein PilV
MSMRHPNRVRSGGFSLVEVMVALVVVSIGLLGLAKMESLALSSTSVAGSRALAAIQAASMAAAMHANTSYWGAGLAPNTGSFTVYYDSSGALQISDSNLATVKTGGCLTAGTSSCTVGEMAAYDVQQWALALKQVLPAPFATIACNTAGFPVICSVTVQWAENAVTGDNMQTVALSAPTYTLFVQP